MNYGKEVKKAKAARSDHRKVKLPLVTTSRRPKRDSKDFVTLEREHDPLGRFGGSLGSVYFDSDGDGKKDTYGKIRRTGSVGGLLETPTFGPIEPPISGPSDLSAEEVLAPAFGPSSLSASINIPLSGPNGLSATVNIPLSGPSGLSASINAPVAGPSSLSASEGSIPAPASGPTDLVASEEAAQAPVAGPSGLTASIATPSEGPSSLSASINAPAQGPSSLNATEVISAPAEGPSSLSASINAPAEGPSSLAAGLAAPVAGPSALVAGIEAPVAGPSGLSAQKETLNIDIVSDQSFADDPNSGTEGEIKYSSDVEYLFIHTGTEWHRINGGNS